MTVRMTNEKLEKWLKEIDAVTEEKFLLPVTVGYKIVKNKCSIEQALVPYRRIRDEIINRYSNGKGFVSEKEEPDIFEKVSSEVALAANEICEVDISPVTLSEVGRTKELPINLISVLGLMITE